jgi:flagellar biosynthetic protein FlhB
MAGEDQDQKTEDPTGKRLDDAREHGQVPVSRETATWVVMLGILIVMGWVIPPMMAQMVDFLHGLVEHSWDLPLDENNAQTLFAHIAGQAALICGG